MPGTELLFRVFLCFENGFQFCLMFGKGLLLRLNTGELLDGYTLNRIESDESQNFCELPLYAQKKSIPHHYYANYLS
ncbi:hypothetical protein VK70_00685 [Paenibacillus durus ATCC 35681]|uniref:Uncharacterized protein n=1 Tax=Paenibacillus durus ATCC 35681 TaxID=1333534 RepID=A0A0F7F686_PAEDU|nr:hypothetical protein VK70_00685 [Paenibacillus durus ATCC 35681]